MGNETLHKRPKINTNELELSPEQTIDLASSIEKPEMAIVTDESVNSPQMQEYLKELEFMRQEVEFLVTPSDDPNAPNPVPCGVNGVIHFLKRGQTYKLPRMFLNALINPSFTVHTRTYKDAEGLDQTEIKKIPVNTVNVSIVNDPAGMLGHNWLQYKMKAA